MIKKFLKYYFSHSFNYLWTISTLIFIILLCNDAYKKEAAVFYMMALIPFFLLVFNVLTEYNAFKNNAVFSSKKLIIGTFLACLAVLLTIVGIMIF